MSPPLDRHASIVSPPSPAHGERKRLRHALRRASGKILKSERVCTCGQQAIGGTVSLHVKGRQAHFSGVETCGSVWNCPVCAAKITEGRKEDIEAVLKAHREAGGQAYMATLTIPHHAFQQPKELRQAVSGAYRKVKSGKRWLTAREGYQWLGDIRALEVTHGENGWHPHLHVLFLFKPGAGSQDFGAFGSWLFDAWARAIERLGFGSCSNSAFSWEHVTEQMGAGDYVGKWGAALELTKGHTKKSRYGRTPWQILEDYRVKGRKRDKALFKAYAEAFKGANQLTWSRDLRKLYLKTPVETDEALATEEDTAETQVAIMDRKVFDQVVRLGRTADVLAAQEDGGLPAVLALLTRLRVPWRMARAPGFLKGRILPRIAPGSPGDSSQGRRNAGFPARGRHLSQPSDFERRQLNGHPNFTVNASR